MCVSPSSSPTPQAAAEMARRLGVILAAVAALIARRFLRDPKFAAVIVPLWGWLGRSARRFERVVMRPAVVRPGVARPAGRAEGSPMAQDAVMRPARLRSRLRLPGGQGWLVKALGWEAAGYGSQLTALLAEPEMQAVLAAVSSARVALRASTATSRTRWRRIRNARARLWRAGAQTRASTAFREGIMTIGSGCMRRSRSRTRRPRA